MSIVDNFRGKNLEMSKCQGTRCIGDNPIFNTASFDTELLSANTLGILAGTAATNQDGGASFYFTLPDPSGSGTLVDRPAALLPGGMGYFYVKGLEDIIR